MASAKNSSTRKKCTTESLIAEFRAVHGDKYDYSKVERVANNPKVTIICPDHGELSVSLYHHRDGAECRRCSMVANGSASISIVEYKGVEYPTLKVLAKSLRLNYATLTKRLQSGFSLDQAVETPYVDRSITYKGVRYKDKKELYNSLKPNLHYQTFIRTLESGMSVEDALSYIPSHGHSNGILYVITNKVNRKQYIGITTETAERRLASHIAGASAAAKRNAESLGAAILKYGAHKFKVEEIQHAPNIKELSRLEHEAIVGMNTFAPNGYNLASGGSIGRPNGKPTTVMGKTFKTNKLASEYVAREKGISFSAAQKRICEGNVDTRPSAKLNMSKAREIRARFAQTGEPHGDIGKDYGVTRECISTLLRNETWKEKAD